MVISEVAITVSIELLARRSDLSLDSILIYRSLLSLALLAIIVRPLRAEWLPRSPWVALLRVLTGGLTYVGWFGAIALLSGRVTQAVLLLDALILAYVRGQRQSNERRTLLVLAAALILFAVQAVREPATVLNARQGILFLLIALGSRAVKTRSNPPSAPPTNAGAISQNRCSPFSMVGPTGYFYMNQVMSMLGAFYTRVVELWQVPMLWAIHLLTEHAHLEWTQGAMSVLVASASAYAYVRHKKRRLK
jgi:hypothetical protein